MNGNVNQDTQRLFYALWPDAALQTTLHKHGMAMREVLGGRLVPAKNIHLTLAFLGSVPAVRMDELHAIGASVRSCSFTLQLARSGCWKRAAVGWMAPLEMPQPLQDIERQLRESLVQAGFVLDARPFAAHVTLLRKSRCTPAAETSLDALAFPPVMWTVGELCLVQSETLQSGPVYTPIARWPLQ